jgi:phospholipase/carboxylesterase
MQGAQWFEIIWDQAGFDCVLEQAWESLSMLEGAYHFWVDKIQPSKTFVAGFSQGGIMALSSVLRSSVNVNGVAIWSGRLIPGLLPNMIHQHPPFCCQHGEFDPVIPVESGREINDWLLEQGIEVEYTEYPMGHSLCDDSIRDTLRWLSAR